MDLNFQVEKLDEKEISIDDAISYIDEFMNCRDELDTYLKIMLDQLIEEMETYKNK